MDVSFRRPPKGGVEIHQFEHMKEKVEGCILADMMDRWFWSSEGSGEFTITSVRKMIVDFMLPEVSSKTRWIKAVPIKVKWKHALASKDKGGLGVSSLFALNRALMFKWVKSYYPSLWLDIIYEVEMFKSRGMDVSFRRPPKGGVEIHQFEHMKEKVEGCILADMMDRWFWSSEGSDGGILIIWISPVTKNG
nr:hypothetical protein [Tanacetum cinerariifolium]